MAWRVNDAARLLSISRSTIYSLVRDGKLKLIRVSGRTLIPDFEVGRLANEGSAP
jgi:excisionase family DNA binding protein